MNAEQTPYEQQVHRIAEILGGCITNYQADDSEFIEAAKMMVAELKNAHYKGYITGLAAMEQFPEDTEKNIDRRTAYYVKAANRLGLIPSPQPKPVSIPPEYPGKDYQPLFDHMSNEHGLTLTVDEMYNIIRLAQKCLGSLTELGTDTSEK